MPEVPVFPSLADALAHGRALGAGWRLSRPDAALRGSAGALLGRRPGSSVEYMDHRDYQPGDDIRRIDWAAYGRSDRLSVRLYREENAPSLDLIVDQTRSMDLPGSGKGAATAAVAGLLLESALAAGFTPALWLASAQGVRKVPSAKAGAWAQVLDFSAVGNPGAALVNRGVRFSSGSVRVLVSDLLWPMDPAAVARRLVAGSSAAHVVRVMAERETRPPALGATRLHDRESGEERPVFVDARVAQAYADNLAAHRAAWAGACRAHGVAWVETTEADFFPQFNPAPFMQARLLEPR